MRAVVFDLDGTLTRPYLDFSQLRQQLGLADGDILQWVAGLPSVEQAQALRMIKAFEQDGVEHAEWNEGAAQVLPRVRSLDLPVAIVTRNSRASLEAVCCRLGITADLLVAREDAPPKPDPTCLYRTAERFGVATENLLVVGDFRHDMEAGRAAGALTVLLTNGHTPSWTVEADLVIERLPDLLAYLA